jgi:hypothetical protein
MEQVTKLKQMVLDVLNKKPSTTFSAVEAEESLRKEIREMAYDADGKLDYYKYQNNKNTIFEIISQTVDTQLPAKVADNIGMFADFQTVANGDKLRFKTQKGISRVKNFVTKVGAGGNYEVAQLDSGFVDLVAYARGGGVLVDFERFLDGTDSLSDLYAALMDGLENNIYMDIQTALKALTSVVPANNYQTHGSFDESKVKKVLATISAYGIPTLMCTKEFAMALTPASGWVGDADKADSRNQGYVGRIWGTNVVTIPQSFTDETNVTKVIDPTYGYVVASGTAKPIKVGYEGQTIIKEVENADMSMEFQVYKKLAVGTVTSNQFGILVNTGVS